jgi:N-acetylneuraminic acid mutarotase
MKRTIILIVFSLNILLPSFSQTIVWKKAASLPEGFYSGEAVSLNNEIYFVAGRNDQSISSSFFKFNPQLNEWTKLANIPNPAINLALAAVNDKIYAIGGDPFTVNVTFGNITEEDPFTGTASYCCKR